MVRPSSLPPAISASSSQLVLRSNTSRRPVDAADGAGRLPLVLLPSPPLPPAAAACGKRREQRRRAPIRPAACLSCVPHPVAAAAGLPAAR